MTFLEGSAPALPKEFRRIRSSLEGRATARLKIFGASGDAPSRSFGLTGRFALPNLEWDGRRNEMGGRGSCRAEMAANGDW
jgi:hypothetical protein